MRIALFYHSLVSDWNHGNAHFLRGVAAELIDRGSEVLIFEPAENWSRQNLIEEFGEAPIRDFCDRFPNLSSETYDLASLDLDCVLEGADLVIVHEWNSHELVRLVGEWRGRNRSARVLFHDTHHRSVTDPSSMAAYDLSNYDGVLAYGEVIRQIYLREAWCGRAWTWHEAADTRVFYPRPARERSGDIVWIGNWGDEERTAELQEFLLDPVKRLGLSGRVHGVRYPEHAIRALGAAGIEFAGWVPNYRAPEIFAQFTATVHVPRRPYVESLPGIPTIRPFEALACSIPLISSPWDDVEGLFRPGHDYLIARNGSEMEHLMTHVLQDGALRAELKMNGLERILSRHTCAHRVDQLFEIYDEIAPAGVQPAVAVTETAL
jgi:spore maturation protein CgeB